MYLAISFPFFLPKGHSWLSVFYQMSWFKRIQRDGVNEEAESDDAHQSQEESKL